MSHEDLLRRAIELARDSVATGGGPFGAVVARNGEIVASGENRVVPSSDPTAHAEIQAIRAASTALATHDLSGCTLYASCEPCPMCLAAIHWARIEEVRYACSRHDAAAAGFDDELLHELLTRPAQARPLRAHQELREEGLEAFRDWDANVDRVQY